jgi:hypothetical protein
MRNVVPEWSLQQPLRDYVAVRGGLSDLTVMLGGMKQVAPEADRIIAKVLRQQAGLITRPQALTAGMSQAALRHKIRSDGPWRAVLPGIYLIHNGPLAGGQREIAAVLYAGHRCVITGLSALRSAGVRAPMTEVVDVLIPQESKRQSAEFVRTHRTIRMPERPIVANGIQWAPVARAVADVARIGLEFGDFRELAAAAVQRGRCMVGELADELRAGPNRGSGLLRTVLGEITDGIASGAEGDLRKLIKSSDLPEPMYNPRLYVGSQFLASPDAWWRDEGVAGEVDSKEWHLSPDQWQRTMERHARMTAQGIFVLHYTPKQIKSDGRRVLAELRAAIEKGRRRPPLNIRTVPSG